MLNLNSKHYLKFILGAFLNLTNLNISIKKRLVGDIFLIIFFSWNALYTFPWERIQLKLYVYQHLQHTRERVRDTDLVEQLVEQDWYRLFVCVCVCLWVIYPII